VQAQKIEQGDANDSAAVQRDASHLAALHQNAKGSVAMQMGDPGSCGPYKSGTCNVSAHAASRERLPLQRVSWLLAARTPIACTPVACMLTAGAHFPFKPWHAVLMLLC